jgi:hypothetical protein
MPTGYPGLFLSHGNHEVMLSLARRSLLKTKSPAKQPGLI